MITSNTKRTLSRHLATLSLAALFAIPSLSHARELAGVNLPDSIDVDGAKLTLNGLGLRKKFIVKVYVAGLYVAQPSSDPAAILSADAARRIDMVFVRDVGKDKIADAFRTGFEKNSASELGKLEDRLKQLQAAVKDIKKGERLTIVYSPGKGTTVSGAANTITLPGKDFADALLRNWLGDKPADDDCKKGMLGQ